MRARGIAIALFLLVACGDEGGTSPGENGPSAPLVCEPGAGVEGDRCAPAGFEACLEGTASDGAPCGELATCAAGTVAFFGQSECTPVGPGECPSGFAREASGFGCSAVIAKAACTGATRARLGSTSCVPVGDCAAAFPPAGATHFVDDSFTPGQVDATHFTTIQAAVAAAPSGATIAIEEGTYTGTVTLPKAVTLVGRCAAKVTLRGVDATTPGVEILRKIKTSVRGLTITDFEVGVSANAGADVALEALVLEENRRLGVLGADAGTRVSAKGLAVRGTLPDGTGRFGHGVAAGFESEITIEDSAITSSSEIGAGAQRGARLTVSRSVIAGVLQRKSNGAYGWGVGAQTGGQVTVTESVVLDTFGGGVVAAALPSDDAVAARVERSFIADVRVAPDASGNPVGSCVFAQGKASADVTGSTCARAEHAGIAGLLGAKVAIASSVVRDLAADPNEAIAGIFTDKKSSSSVTRTAVVDATIGGILAGGKLEASDVYVSNVSSVGVGARGEATLTRVVVTGTKRSVDAEDNRYGAGVIALDGSTLDATDVLVRRSEGLGVLAISAGTKVSVRRAAIVDTQAIEEGSGIAIAVTSGAELTLEDAAILRASDAAVYVSGAGTAASLRGVSVIDTKPNGASGQARALNVEQGAALNLARVFTRGGAEVGLAVLGEDARATVEGSVFEGVAKTASGFGHGVGVSRGGALVMTRSIVRGHAGVGLVFSNASGSVASSIVRANPVGVHVQEGVDLVEAAAAPGELTPLSVVFTTDTRFEENGTKVGAGEVPLPAPIDVVGP
ncbi:MAG: hypothetical protein KF764_22565 [Labilithrix sp.]|nr:hypothetical protein [Labilithrix sp.]